MKNYWHPEQEQLNKTDQYNHHEAEAKTLTQPPHDVLASVAQSITDLQTVFTQQLPLNAQRVAQLMMPTLCWPIPARTVMAIDTKPGMQSEPIHLAAQSEIITKQHDKQYFWRTVFGTTYHPLVIDRIQQKRLLGDRLQLAITLQASTPISQLGPIDFCYLASAAEVSEFALACLQQLQHVTVSVTTAAGETIDLNKATVILFPERAQTNHMSRQLAYQFVDKSRFVFFRLLAPEHLPPLLQSLTVVLNFTNRTTDIPLQTKQLQLNCVLVENSLAKSLEPITVHAGRLTYPLNIDFADAELRLIRLLQIKAINQRHQQMLMAPKDITLFRYNSGPLETVELQLNNEVDYQGHTMSLFAEVSQGQVAERLACHVVGELSYPELMAINLLRPSAYRCVDNYDELLTAMLNYLPGKIANVQQLKSFLVAHHLLGDDNDKLFINAITDLTIDHQQVWQQGMLHQQQCWSLRMALSAQTTLIQAKVFFSLLQHFLQTHQYPSSKLRLSINDQEIA